MITNLNENPIDRLRFFLGGHDLEMLTIRQLLVENVPTTRIHDRLLSWGAKASAYAGDIRKASQDDFVPVLVELELDISIPPSAIIIDHHGARAGIDQPTSLEQIFALLQLPQNLWTRHMTLVAANDRGYIDAMLEQHAMPEEIFAIRAADRRAQGVSLQHEAEARDAIQKVQIRANGQLSVVSLPHSHSSAVTDVLHSSLGGPGFQNLIVCTPSSINVFGNGALIEHLKQVCPRSWFGGQLPVRGFWGAKTNADDVIRVAESFLTASESQIPILRP